MMRASAISASTARLSSGVVISSFLTSRSCAISKTAEAPAAKLAASRSPSSHALRYNWAGRLQRIPAPMAGRPWVGDKG